MPLCHWQSGSAQNASTATAILWRHCLAVLLILFMQTKELNPFKWLYPVYGDSEAT